MNERMTPLVNDLWNGQKVVIRRSDAEVAGGGQAGQEQGPGQGQGQG